MGLISIGATMQAGVDVLAMHWDVVEQRAREFGKTADRDRWRVVGLMHLADTREQALADVRHGIREFCDYLQHTAAAPQMQVTGSTIDEYIAWALGTGSTEIGTWQDAIAHIEQLLAQSNGGFGCYLLFDHNWAPFAAKKRHYEIFGDFVVPHFKGTHRRMQNSEAALRAVRDPLAAEQLQAIAAFRARHAARGAKREENR
jgi:limonene 1,2-monooxygenase